jgi:hypothetical protein
MWQLWRASLSIELQQYQPENIPKDWQKRVEIADEVIKRCPFCHIEDIQARRKNGNLEHLHLYCTSQMLVDTRSFCYQKIEDAIIKLYDFASNREFGYLFKILIILHHYKRI